MPSRSSHPNASRYARTLFAAAAVLGATSAHAQVSIYLSAPGATSSGFSNTDVENFESLTTGIKTSDFLSPNFGTATGVTGTYQGSVAHPYAIGPASDPWSVGSNYFAVGTQSGSTATATLQLSSSVGYFGFSWNAGDNNNRMAFYNHGAVIAVFSSANIQTLLANPTVTAIDGSVYSSSSYKGQPGNTTINSGENYAFVHFLIAGGADRIDFWNTGGSGFESDNHTLRTIAPSVAGSSLVFVTTASAPEPSTFGLLALGAIIGSVLMLYRKDSLANKAVSQTRFAAIHSRNSVDGS
jgi:PEP-CTERM motif